MPSESLIKWRTSRAAQLDELEEAHRAVGGIGRGRRYATQQLNHAYAVLFSSQFQGFCRDLHTEVCDYIVEAVDRQRLHGVVWSALTGRRALDRGNPTPGAIGTDFERFRVAFWKEVYAMDRRNEGRRGRLETLNLWRNAIAHQDFDAAQLGGQVTLTLSMVRSWRSACTGLAAAFDEVVRAHVEQLIEATPW